MPVWPPPQLPAMPLILSIKMVHLVEDGAMFKIARFRKQSRNISDHSEILRIACKPAGIDNLNSEPQLTDRSEQLISRADSLLG
jgi:hypothetical protein